MAIEQWGFFSVPHLLWHGASVYNGQLRGPVTLAPNAERLAVELSLYSFNDLGQWRPRNSNTKPACMVNALTDWPSPRHCDCNTYLVLKISKYCNFVLRYQMSSGINCEQNKPAEIPRYVIMQKKNRIIVEIFSYWYTCIRERLEDLSISWEFEYEKNLWFFRIVSHRIIPFYEIVKKIPCIICLRLPVPLSLKKKTPPTESVPA